MKAFRALFLAPLLLAAPALYSQDAPAPEQAAQPAPALPAGPAPSSTDLTPAEDVPVKPPVDPAAPKLDLMPAQDTPAMPPESTLIPETIEPVEKPAGTAVPQPGAPAAEPTNKTAASADALEKLVRFRIVQTRAVKDPAVQAEWETSERVDTDYEKRAALRRYYRVLFARMEKIDASLKPEIEVRRDQALRRLQQTKIDPTQPPRGVTPDPEIEFVSEKKTTKESTKTKSKKKASKERKEEKAEG